MRALTIIIRPEDGFHPANNALADESSIHRVALHHFQLLDDRTVVLLYELRGDLGRAEQILTSHPSIISCEVSGNTHGIAFIHSRPVELSEKLLGLTQQYELAVDTPIDHVEDGGIRVTFIGESSALQQALSAVPTNVDITIERIEQHQNRPIQIVDILTERQREIVEIAVKQGYYEIPRRTSQQELAQILEISPGTVSEHLNKIESSTIKSLFG